MTKRIIFILLAVFWGLGLQAQTVEKDGTYYYDAIPVTFDIGKMIFTDVRDTRKVPPWYNSFIYMPKGSSHYQKTQGNAVFYRMEIPASGNVIVHNWNSRMGFSSLFVYRLLSSPGCGVISLQTAAFRCPVQTVRDRKAPSQGVLSHIPPASAHRSRLSL